MINYGFSKVLSATVDEVITAVSIALPKEGFGILTKIAMHEKFREKLGVDFLPYYILGACNPGNAYAAVQAEENIGLFLPCNIIVYETGHGVVLSIIKPSAAMASIGNTLLELTAIEVEEKLKRVFDSIV